MTVRHINHVQLDAAIEEAIEVGNYHNDTIHMDAHIDLMAITGMSEGALMHGKPEARTALYQAGIQANYQVFERDGFGIMCAGYVWHYQGLRLMWAF